MSDLNKLQNMDHQELTNAAQRPEDQYYEQPASNPEEEKSGLTSKDESLANDTSSRESEPPRQARTGQDKP